MLRMLSRLPPGIVLNGDLIRIDLARVLGPFDPAEGSRLYQGAARDDKGWQDRIEREGSGLIAVPASRMWPRCTIDKNCVNATSRSFRES